ncbi:unnamed protein product [Thelazia callipaeda]|uniref:Tautomerase family protein n=1 Tax=Thelazia callipaeda TaxID=103827 RepID=A0A0N5D0I3_THECL|nr:unnamed protein product [Thelazia callipaeda]
MPILFADIPKGLNIEEFKKNLAALFSLISCSHMHAYQVWPGNSFDVFLNLSYRRMLNSDEALQQAQGDFAHIQKQTCQLLKAIGANNVTVQVDIVRGDGQNIKNRCVGRNCLKKSCCDSENIVP